MRRKLLLILFVSLLLGAMLVSAAYAQTGSGFDLHWNVQGGGGGSGSMSGSGFDITGTLGQTAVSSSTGSVFTVQQGFWYVLLSKLGVYLPVIMK
jgi:hypothetical protein